MAEGGENTGGRIFASFIRGLKISKSQFSSPSPVYLNELRGSVIKERLFHYLVISISHRHENYVLLCDFIFALAQLVTVEILLIIQ